MAHGHHRRRPSRRGAVLAPDEQLADIPLGALAWQPENFDRAAHGLVNAQEALGKSYNLTAVRLLRRAGGERFLEFLVEAGIVRRPGGAPGLSLILGASEVRTPPGAAHLDGFACKTGTSWGRRDAWAIAYTPRFTVAVWAGNFSGEGSPSLVGGEAARPCAIEVLSWLDPRPRWPAPPPGIRAGLVCAETGLAAGAWCPAKVKGRLLAADSRACEVHERHAVDARSGALLCGECMAGREVAWQVFARWPADIEAYLRARGKPALPAHQGSCAAIAPGGGRSSRRRRRAAGTRAPTARSR